MSTENLAVGIDLGTTYSCIAYVDEFGKPVVLKNFEGDSITPSVVYFPENTEEVVVGKEAKKEKSLEPERVIDFIKRSIGRPNSERFIDDKKYRPEQISAQILKKIIQDAEKVLGKQINKAVITCPAYFGINEREATAQAGTIASLQGYTEDEQINIIPEPTAAAFYYGLQKANKDETVLVYDLGGGTFDVTLLAIKEGSVEAICIGGNHELGGKDWDDILMNYCLDLCKEQGLDIDMIMNDPLEIGELSSKVEDAKKSLTSKEKALIGISLGGIRQKIELTQDKFNELTQSKLETTITLCNDMLRDAEAKGFTSFDRILLVGGSTKMPQIKDRLVQEFPNIPVEFNEPDEAVAKGAALFAQKLMIDNMITEELFKLTGQSFEGKDIEDIENENNEILTKARENVATTIGLPDAQLKKLSKTKIKNITSKSFGVVVVRDDDHSIKEISNLIVKNSSLPAIITKQFGTLYDNQESVDIRIMENLLLDEIVDLSLGKELGNAILKIPNRIPKGSPIEITFNLDNTGLLNFFGKDLNSENVIEGEIHTDSVMSQEELEMAKTGMKSTTIV
jgi:molecular chaperone DnaK (HSP70)